jgi:hypothetical protein
VIAYLSLPLLNGMDAPHILILTMYADNAFVAEAFQVGVALNILKQSWSIELPKVAPAAPRARPCHSGSSPCDAGPGETIPTDLGTLYALYQQLGEKARGAKEGSDTETSTCHGGSSSLCDDRRESVSLSRSHNERALLATLNERLKSGDVPPGLVGPTEQHSSGVG